MVVCPKCGNENDVCLGQTACFRCGAELPKELLPSEPQPSVPDSTEVATVAPKTYLFATIYTWLCFFGCFVAVCIIAAVLFHAFQTGDWQRAASEIVAMLFMFILWFVTGLSILRRQRRAMMLSYIGAAVAVVGILARGFVPLDILLAIPTFAIVFYLREHSDMLT